MIKLQTDTIPMVCSSSPEPIKLRKILVGSSELKWPASESVPHKTRKEEELRGLIVAITYAKY